MMVEIAGKLNTAVDALSFSSPISHVYNPLSYAWQPHEQYLRRYGRSHKRVLFIGMNPGPWGMAQCGIPFGEIQLVQEWLGITGQVDRPVPEHPKRPVHGFDCSRSEVSGRRLWGLFRERFGSPETFFKDHFVANYCPLVFMEESGRNRTPDKISGEEIEKLYTACDRALKDTATTLRVKWVIGVGKFAGKCASRVCADIPGIEIADILHPSPASPAANRGWGEAASKRLRELGVWI